MKLLDDYFATQKALYDYFGYAEDWRVIPIEDRRDMFWYLQGEGPGDVFYAKQANKLPLDDEAERDGDYYSDEIYTQRHLKKWVYRGADYTMVCVDTHTDGNQFLAIYDNAKEVKR